MGGKALKDIKDLMNDKNFHCEKCHSAFIGIKQKKEEFERFWFAFQEHLKATHDVDTSSIESLFMKLQITADEAVEDLKK